MNEAHHFCSIKHVTSLKWSSNRPSSLGSSKKCRLVSGRHSIQFSVRMLPVLNNLVVFLSLSRQMDTNYDGDSISKLQIVIEKNRMAIMAYRQHLFFNIISIQI